MNISFNSNCEGFDSNKKLELLNKIIQFTGLRYVGEFGNYVKPLGLINGLPYMESNYLDDNITIRRITNLDDEFKPHFIKTVETVYSMVMGLIEPKWDDVRRVSIFDKNGNVFWNVFPSLNEVRDSNFNEEE